MRNYFRILIISLVSSMALQNISLASPPPKFKKKYLTLALKNEMYDSKANYDDDDGTFADLENGGSYKSMQTELYTLFSFIPRWGYFSSLTFNQSTADDGFFDRNNSQLTDFKLGFNYRLMVKPVYLQPELMVIVPVYKVKENTDESIPGEGALGVQAGAWLEKKINFLVVYGYAGFRYRDDGRSALLPWTAGAYGLFDFIGVGAEVYGFNSVIDDDKTDMSDREIITDRVNAGSKRYYSVNPSLMSYMAWIGYRSDFFNAQVGYGSSFNGQNTAAGNTIFLNVAWTFYTGSPIETPDNDSPFNRDTERKVKKFEPAAENYDENLFKDKKVKKSSSPNYENEAPLTEEELLNETQELLE